MVQPHNNKQRQLVLNDGNKHHSIQHAPLSVTNHSVSSKVLHTGKRAQHAHAGSPQVRESMQYMNYLAEPRAKRTSSEHVSQNVSVMKNKQYVSMYLNDGSK